ncbi:MAG: 16S rRNA (cytosine(1402)-N(4))-methyltransferase RsmH, partial [Eubacteriales bacterium]|nr:16S rRNA (cytosine(1402)-N(4))-methyltransferase RsmH [Eubacteriales bacterium]
FGIDRDGEAIREAENRLQPYGDAFTAVRGNFFNMKELLFEKGVTAVDGVLLDLGVSSHQLDAPERGFSYHEQAPLDMRMDDRAALSAYDVVNGYSVEELTRVIREYGEERFAYRVANAIAREREATPIKTTTALAEIIKSAIPAANRREGPHPARRTFQALRIEVNGELDGLAKALKSAETLLAPGGRLAVITFHSLEDRIVKQTFRELEHPCTCPPKAPVCVCGKVATSRILTKKPLIPSSEEEQNNPRARSAKLRGIEKL